MSPLSQNVLVLLSLRGYLFLISKGIPHTHTHNWHFNECDTDATLVFFLVSLFLGTLELLGIELCIFIYKQNQRYNHLHKFVFTTFILFYLRRCATVTKTIRFMFIQIMLKKH